MKEILTTLFRRKRAFLVFCACMVAFPMALTYILPAKYQAKATVLLTPGRFKKPFLPDERDDRVGFMQVSTEDVGSEVELMTSYPVLAKVVEVCGLDRREAPSREQFLKWSVHQALQGFGAVLRGLGLAREVPARDAAINQLRSTVRVDFIRRTNIIKVSWRASSPERARDVVNALFDAYLTHHIRVHGHAYMLDALRAQLSASRENLRRAEDSLSAYTSRNKISDVDAQRRNHLVKLGQADSRIQLLRSISMRNLSQETLGEITDDPAVVELSRRLTDAEMRRIDLATRYGADDRKLLASAQEIDRLKTFIRRQVEKSLATWKSLAGTYQAQLAALDSQKIEIDRIRQEIGDLQRMVELNREKADEVIISNAMDKAALAGARLVEEAVADPVPVFPNRMSILIISLFFGVVLGTALVVAMDAATSRLLSVDDVEKAAQAPVLASVPLFRTGKVPGLENASEACAEALLPVPTGLSRTGAGASSMRSILLVSPAPGAGTTSLCNHLGGMLATTGSTAILSLDPGNGSGRPGVGPDAEPSMEEALVRDERYGVYRLTLPAGPGRLAGGGFSAQSVVDALREAGIRHLLIDAGAPRTDARYLQFVHLVNHVILVAAYDLTSKPALARLAEIIRRQGGPLAGCLFNRRQDPIPERLYRRLF